jgi:tRNA U34 5-carboxymethylaminomethyl modifying GTPase MnmE/TrmE
MQAAPAARRITGALDVKDLLDVIFRDFCIIP